MGQAYGVGEIGTCMYMGISRTFLRDVRVSRTTNGLAWRLLYTIQPRKLEGM
jgi:hypothetical protein